MENKEEILWSRTVESNLRQDSQKIRKIKTASSFLLMTDLFLTLFGGLYNFDSPTCQE